MGARAESAQDHGGASAYRSDGKVDRESRSDENERGAALERIEVISDDEACRALDIPQFACRRRSRVTARAHWNGELIATAAQLAGVIPQIETGRSRGGRYRSRQPALISGEALSCFKSVCRRLDYIVDPLADVDLAPLRLALERTEIVLHGADYDLRMLRRGLNFVAAQNFRHSDCSPAARHPRVQSGCAGETVLRPRASERFTESKLGAAAAAGAHGGIRDQRCHVTCCRWPKNWRQS